MRISRHKVVDLGVLPDETDCQDYFGASFDTHDGSVVGRGGTAREAMQDALNNLAVEGFDAVEVERTARDEGWFGPDAEVSAPTLVDPEDDALVRETPTYFVGIRFDSPDLDDEDDGEGGDDDDDDGPPPEREPVPVRRASKPAGKIIDI